MKSREIKASDRKRLFVLSGCECANPSCSNKLMAKDYNTILGEICHIEAASPEGPRYNPNQTDEERRSFDNLILLCESCHKEIDNKLNESKYPVALLKEWKKNHQEKILNSKHGKLPSYFQQIVSAIANKGLMDDDTIISDPTPYEISKKIAYNNLCKNRCVVEDYNIYSNGLHAIYDELEEFGTIKKNVVLSRIRNFYLKAKGEYTNGTIEDIRLKSDKIFDTVVDRVCELVKDTQIDDSELSLAVEIVVVDAFIDCKVLEKPIS